MADDKTLRGPRDSSRIAMGEDYEVAYWTDKFGVSRERLQAAVDAGILSRFAVPDRVRFVDSLPRTSVGKLNKRAMREAL